MMAFRKGSPAPRGNAGREPNRNILRRHSSQASRAVKIDFDAVNRAAIAALPAVLARLVPGGRIMGREYAALNPRRADRRAGSFKVRVFGPGAGRWADFATGDKGGDPVSLAAYLENCSQAEAARRLAGMLGVKIGEGAR
jgi:predicted PhzF superfamily epimerase YddE/YHI9